MSRSMWRISKMPKGFSTEIWEREFEMEDFLIRRKVWARELLAAHGLGNPGDQISGEFEDKKYLIEIGPRRGINIFRKL